MKRLILLFLLLIPLYCTAQEVFQTQDSSGNVKFSQRADGSFTNAGTGDIGASLNTFGANTNWGTVRNKANITNDAILHQAGNLVLNGQSASRLVATDANKNLVGISFVNGQVLIGNNSGNYTAATLSQGAGLIVGNGAGSITLSWNNTNVTLYPQAGSAGAIPLTITVPSSQNGDMLDWVNNGVVVAYLNSGGSFFTTGISSATNGFASSRSNGIAPFSFTFPATTVNWTNTIPVNIEVYIDNSGVTGTALKKNGTQIFSSLVGDVTLGLQPGEYISATYSIGTPTARWSPQ